MTISMRWNFAKVALKASANEAEDSKSIGICKVFEPLDVEGKEIADGPCEKIAMRCPRIERIEGTRDKEMLDELLIMSQTVLSGKVALELIFEGGVRFGLKGKCLFGRSYVFFRLVSLRVLSSWSCNGWLH